MPATALRCRVCETQYPLDPIGVCAKCFGPLDPVYDRDEQRRGRCGGFRIEALLEGVDHVVSSEGPPVVEGDPLLQADRPFGCIVVRHHLLGEPEDELCVTAKLDERVEQLRRPGEVRDRDLCERVKGVRAVTAR